MAENPTNESGVILDTIVANPYKYGFRTDIESEEFEKGLNLEIVQKISQKKAEPQFLKQFREKAFKSWQKMTEPSWAYLNVPSIDFDSIQYYSVPKTKKKNRQLRRRRPRTSKDF